MPQTDTKLHVGASAPDFTLSDRNGETYRLSDVVKRGPVLLCFFRGTWCPDCRVYLKKLESYYHNFQASGITVLGIAHQRADIVAGYFQREPISYPYLLDTDLRVISAYGLLEPFRIDALLVSRAGAQTTIPAYLLIDQNMNIRWLYVSSNKRDLPEPAEIEAEAERLGLVMSREGQD